MLFMDDLKLFGKSMNEIDSLVKTVETCCADIGMAFGIAKCAVLNLKRGKLAACDGLELQSGDKIECVDESGYKYLGVLGCTGSRSSVAWRNERENTYFIL